MTLDDLRAAISAGREPSGPPLIRALWFDARGDWETAHGIAQDVADTDGAWVHAYLHRREGDEWNAGYWYRRAGRTPCTGSLDAEWTAIAQALLGRS